MLYELEDLGGYEPAQTVAYSKFMDEIHEPEPFRRPWPNHFGLVVNPSAREFLDAGNVRAAIMPRFGVPMFFRPVQEQVSVAAGAWREKNIRALMIGTPDARVRLFAIEGQNQKLIAEAVTHRISLADDQVVTGSTIPRDPAPLAESIVVADFVTGNDPADALAIQVSPGMRFIEGYAWGKADAALWKPVQIGEAASLMEYKGTPVYAEWRSGTGKILRQEIKANRVVLDVQTTSGSLLVHDAFWPGWKAMVDGKPVTIQREGQWRKIDLPASARRVVMEYHPALVRKSAAHFAAGVFCLIVLCWVGRLSRKTNFVAEGQSMAEMQRRRRQN